MAGNNTQLTPSEVTAMAGRHRTVASEITGQQRALQGEISTIAGANKGAMVTRLVSVHEEWDRLTKNIVTNLETMAETLNRAATALEGRDSSNASSISI